MTAAVRVLNPAPDDDFARLRLIRSDNVGPVTYRQLLRRFGSASRALAALPDLAQRGGGTARIAPEAAVAAELAAVARFGARFVFLGDPDYPFLLAQTETAPPALAVKGDLRLLDRPAVAMVGARNASAAAVRFARELATALADAELVVVSGLARGIDAAAHWGALAGGTIGVVAGGIDVVYPPENAELQARIGADGLLVAEAAFGTQPQARHFPRRNRIIAGLCAGTVVVEGALKSGSLITARIAAEAGREVMAVPGSPLDPRAQGCNQLIREGATLIQSAADVIEALRTVSGDVGGRLLSPDLMWEPAPDADVDDATRSAVEALLSPVPVAIDELVRQTNCPSATVAAALLDLELSGRIVRHAGGRVSAS
ncbi:MAG: DNA-protecting protein DprA [Sphingomonadaceae bacterium]|nr:DNA-protecting protein DprA [Sphingomonadaceae bacterium]